MSATWKFLRDRQTGLLARHVVVECVAKAGEQVVEGQRAGGAAAAGDLSDDLVDQDSEAGGGGAGGLGIRAGNQLGLGVAQGQQAGSLEMLQLRDLLHRVLGPDRLTHEQIDGHLTGQRLRVVDQHRIGIGGHRGAERAEDLLSEPVDRRDRGRVELGDGGADSAQAVHAIVPPHDAQRLLIGSFRRLQGSREVNQSGPHAVPQLSRRGRVNVTMSSSPIGTERSAT